MASDDQMWQPPIGLATTGIAKPMITANGQTPAPGPGVCDVVQVTSWRPAPATTVADRMLAAHYAHESARDAVDSAIEATGCTSAAGWDFTVDSYDQSIEVYAPGVTDAAKLRAACKAMGFALVWIHDHDGGREGCADAHCGERP